MLIQSQLLATKFFVPVASGTLISRPRLTALLDESLKRPLTLVSAPAGFGKTTLLATWAQSLPASKLRVAWVSLDEEDNDLLQFWTYVLSALDMHPPERFTPLLKYLQSPQSPSIKNILTVLSNLLLDSPEHFVLILDDYHAITEEQVHTTLSSLMEHFPPQLHIILATRTDPPLLLSLLRARGQMMEIRTDQLRCTAEETGTIFQEVIGVQLPEKTIQEVTTRTEGWLVGLRLLGLSLAEYANPLSLLEEVSGDQRYILDYLTEEVLRRQPQEVQMFLLYTCILEHLTASLCDAVMEQAGSQQMLHQLERANLFVVSLDSKREWYRYHALFAEALRYQLEQTSASLVLALHHRASLWYAKHDRTTQAILHAFRAKEWQWAADLIEQKSLQLTAYTWGASEHEQVLLREWIEQLPIEVMGSRPRLCLTCHYLLWPIAPPTTLEAWLKAAEATLSASLTMQTREDVSHPMLDQKAHQEQQNLLGDVLAVRAFRQSYDEKGEAVLTLCQQALSLLSADNYYSRTLIAWARLQAYYYSSANDAEAAVQAGLQAISLAQASGKDGMVFTAMCSTARYTKQSGRLHEAQRLMQQTIELGREPGGLVVPEVGWPMLFQAELLREWNKLDAARMLIEEAIPLCRQSKIVSSLIYIFLGYSVLLRISLSRGELEVAYSALEEFERLGRSVSRPFYLFMRSFYTTVDQVRLWLACGELEQATRWATKLEVAERPGPPFELEREDVACVRILLAKKQPNLALQRLEPVLQRAAAGKRWGHVIEIRLLQALAHQMCQREMQALDALSEAVRPAEPEGFIRSFVDEGTPMEALLSKLQEQQGKDRPTPYLDTLLAAFPQQSKLHRRQPKQSRRSK